MDTGPTGISFRQQGEFAHHTHIHTPQWHTFVLYVESRREFMPLCFMQMNQAVMCVQWIWKQVVLWWEVIADYTAQHLQCHVQLFDKFKHSLCPVGHRVTHVLMHLSQIYAYLRYSLKKISSQILPCLFVPLTVCFPAMFFCVQLFKLQRPVGLGLTDWLHSFCQSVLRQHHLGLLYVFSASAAG